MADRDVVLVLANADQGERTVTLNRGFLGARRAIGCRILDRSILYLRVPRLGAAAPSQMREAARSAGEISGRLIVDLRGTEGGSPVATFGVVDLFVSSGEMGELIYRGGRKRFIAKAGDPLEGATLVVLIGRKTKGGGELIALAVQDRRRGWVLGERTAVETNFFSYWPLEGGDVLQLFGALVLRPGGGRFGAEAEPDVVAETEPIEARPYSDVACPGTEDAGEVQTDALVGRAVRLLRRPPGRETPKTPSSGAGSG